MHVQVGRFEDAQMRLAGLGEGGIGVQRHDRSSSGGAGEE